MSSPPVFCSCRGGGAPLDHLALVVQVGFAFLGPTGLLTIREIILRISPSPGHCTDSVLKSAPSLFVKRGLFTCAGASA